MGIVVTVVSRLLNKVHREGDCIVWHGAKAGAGYGIMSIDSSGKPGYVHRLSYEYFVGEIEDGLEIDHLCGNRLCVNTMHLEAVTHAENRRRARSELCKRGHPLSEGRAVPGHGRACRKCDAIRAARYREKRANS